MAIEVYTDGSARPNPGPGGWAALVNDKMISGRNSGPTTNNEMEMLAVLYALGECPDGEEVIIHTDSKMVVGWLCRSWQTKSNPKIGEIRQAISKLVYAKKLDVGFDKVKGHGEDEKNIRLDAMARMEATLAGELG
jgi:ribonuclease HI